MIYKFTSQQQYWLQDLIDLLPADEVKTKAQNWLDKSGITVNDAALNALHSYFKENERLGQITAFVAWVKGGVRPGKPH